MPISLLHRRRSEKRNAKSSDNDKQVPQNFIPGLIRPETQTDDKSKASPRLAKKNFIKTAFFKNNKDINIVHQPCSNPNCRTCEDRISLGNDIELRKRDSLKEKRRSRSFSGFSNLDFNEDFTFGAQDDGVIGDYHPKLIRSVSNQSPLRSRSAAKLPKILQPTNNMSILHPELFVPEILEKNSPFSRSRSVIDKTFLNVDREFTDLRPRSQSLHPNSDIINLKHKISLENCLRSQSWVPMMDLNEETTEETDQSSEEEKRLSTISNPNSKDNLNVYNGSDGDYTNGYASDSSALSTNEVRRDSGLRLNLDFDKKIANKDEALFIAAPDINVCVNGIRVEDFDEQIYKNVEKFEQLSRSANDLRDMDIIDLPNLYRPRSNSLFTEKHVTSDIKTLQEDSLRNGSLHPRKFTRSQSLIASQIKVIDSGRFFDSSGSSVYGGSSDESDNTVKLRPKRNSVSRDRRNRRSFSESSIYQAFKAMDKDDERPMSKRLSKTFFEYFDSQQDEETKRFISDVQTAMRSKLPKTYHAAVIDPFSVWVNAQKLKKATIKEDATNSDSEIGKSRRNRTKSLPFFQGSPRLLRKGTLKKQSTIDEQVTKPRKKLHLSLNKQCSNINAVNEENPNRLSPPAHGVFRRALQYSSCDESGDDTPKQKPKPQTNVHESISTCVYGSKQYTFKNSDISPNSSFDSPENDTGNDNETCTNEINNNPVTSIKIDIKNLKNGKLNIKTDNFDIQNSEFNDNEPCSQLAIDRSKIDLPQTESSPIDRSHSPLGYTISTPQDDAIGKRIRNKQINKIFRSQFSYSLRHSLSTPVGEKELLKHRPISDNFKVN